MMIAAMMVATLTANAQNEVGQITFMPKAGLNLATITSIDNSKMKPGLVAGAEFEYGVANDMTFSAGVLYSMEGTKLDGGIKFNMDYINVPILANYYIAPGFAVKAGIQPAFNVRKKASYNGESVNIDDLINTAAAAVGFPVDTKVQAFNLSVPVGLSYEFKNIVLDARYNIGVTKLFKNADNGRNSTIAITLGYKFAL